MPYDFLIAVLIVVISFSGLIAGFILRKFVKEEVEKGKWSFVFSFRIILFAFILFLFYLGFKSYLFYIGFLVGLILGTFIPLYFLLGLSLFVNFSNYLFLNNSFIFVLGIFYGVLKERLKIFLNLFFFLVPFLLFFLGVDLILIYLNYLILGFVSGGLLRRIKKM